MDLINWNCSRPRWQLFIVWSQLAAVWELCDAWGFYYCSFTGSLRTNIAFPELNGSHIHSISTSSRFICVQKRPLQLHDKHDKYKGTYEHLQKTKASRRMWNAKPFTLLMLSFRNLHVQISVFTSEIRNARTPSKFYTPLYCICCCVYLQLAPRISKNFLV